MPHGNSSQDTQPQPPKPTSGNDGDQQRSQKATPQSPAPTFAPAVSSPGPQSPGYQIQQLIMSRNPVPGQNVNITLQNVGPVVAGNQQITLTPLPLPNPASPGFQFSSQTRRFEHGSPSYIQVTSPISQQVQTQSPTQPTAVPIQALQGVRATTAGTSLGMCSQSPTRGFVDAGLIVRQLSLGPSASGHFVFQEGTGITQIAQGAQVHLPSGTSTPIQARTLLHSNSQTVGSVQFGSQSPVTTGASHITTTNLPPQISSIIQGQLIQQQQVLHSQQLGRTISFDRTSGGMIAGVAGTSTFGIASQPAPTSPSRAAGPAPSSLPLASIVKKQSKKLEEIPPATQEDARMRKQCLDHHHKTLKALKENFKDYMIELFFLQYFQGNMMDFLAFKKKPTIQLQNYLRQNDLDAEVEEEEGDKSSLHLTQTQDPPESPVSENTISMETQASSMQRETPIDAALKPLQDSSESTSHHLKVTLGIPQTPPTQSKTVGMPSSETTVAPPNHRQSDPTKVSTMPNSTSLHSPSRTQSQKMPITFVPNTLHPTQQQQPPVTDAQIKGKTQTSSIPVAQSAQNQMSQQSQVMMLDQPLKPQQGSDPASLYAAPSSPATPASASDSIPPAVSPKRILSPGASRSPRSTESQPQDNMALISEDVQQEVPVPKPLEQESHIHQRIAELRKEGLWSLRRLPKLQEASRPKSHWDYLLEEMQWMAADFAQERMWKVASAKKLVRTAARYWQEKQQNDARAKKENEERLRRIAWFAAREIQHFWYNIEQVVEIKLQVDLQTKRKKVFCTQRGTLKGEDKAEILVKGDESSGPSSSQTIKKADTPKAENDDGVQKQLVLIDSLLNIEGGVNMEQRKNSRDIAEVAAAAELLLPRGSSRITCTVKSSPPPLLHGSLREYQQIGLDWLAKQFKKNLNGILADETGLGKNVQVIALMAHLASKEGVWGPHLIVVRSCKLLKWELEFKRWCPALKLLLYFGSQRELRRKRQKWDEPNYFNVCITSYKQLFKGHKAFMKMRWKYLVMDEVHQIKNMTEKHWEAIFKLPSQRRLLLRDTPLPHTWKELWTMVHFLIPGLSRPYLDFPVKENRDQDQEYKHTISIRLHRTAQPFILRRSKRDVERQLTKKSEHVLKCQLSNRQRTLYEDVMMQPGTQDALKGGHFVSVLHVLMQLQKICNHPELVDPRPERSSYVCEALKYQTASLILRALEYDPWKNADLSMFDFLGMENKMTRYEAQVLPKQKVSRKLIQEIYSSPDPAPRPSKVQLKPSRLFEPVLYGQKPEGRMVAFPSSPATRTVTTTTSTGTQQGQVKRSQATTPAAPQGTKVPSTTQVQIGGSRPPATFTTAAPVRQMNQPHSQTPLHAVQPNVPSQRLVLSSQARLPSGEVVKIAQLAAGGGTQGRIAQPETPVTLQFQGNKFTLSQSQLRQLTAGQPLQLQGNVLQIVSAPGQYLRPQGSIVLPTMPQGTAANAVRSQQVAAPNSSAAPPAAAMAGKNTQTPTAAADQGTKPASNMTGTAQESTEDKLRIVKERLDSIFAYNELRCARAPLYGADLLSLCTLNATAPRVPNGKRHWSWSGSVNCRASSCSPEGSSDPLRHLILSPSQQKAALESLAKRSLCVVPAAVSAPPAMMVPHPPPSYTHNIKLLSQSLKEQVAPSIRDLRERTSPYCVQFPDVRLVQLDSGKLEALVILLKKLKSEGRRILLFSQMLHMLDILEVFLDFHSITFLRMDENANSDQCQDLIKSYNRDPRIFCMVLSTHVYAMSVPHIEADTVIFYDSDLNPVVDGKTQSWCDLIGRSKDIHVYRLVTANSVEEKLLRNGTKDLIREVAAQGSDYTLAFLTQQTIQELFEVCSPLEDSGFRVKAEEFVLLSQEPSPSDTITAKTAKPFVEALGRIERGTEEAAEHIQEDGPQPNAGICPSDDCELNDNLESSHLQELADLMKQLTPIEKYALHYLELSHIRNSDVHLGYIEEQLKAATQQWDSQHLRGLKEREKKMEYETEENEELLTYTREDAYNMDFIYDGPDGQTEIMPVWTPPTPPQDENDIYIDSVMCLMYDTSPIPESKLPPVYVRKERKRHRTDPAAAGRKKKLRHGESVAPPRSLFDRAAPNPLKVRKEGKEQKKNILLKQQTQFAKPLPTLIKPVMETGPDNPEWLISEDWALLQAVKQLLELPLNLAVVSPAHTPNWDLVSDVVNSCSRIYRSSKQCKSRYENVIIPREEGKLLYDASPKKKSENPFKNKPLRTSQIYTQDEGMSHSQLFTTRFELMKMTAGKRSPPIKPLLGMNPFQKNPKHASVLAESGINYDKPLPPIQVASLRADRIAKEKKALVDQVRAQQQSGPVTQQPQQNGQQPAQSTSVQPAQVQAQTPAGTQQQVVVQQQPATKGPNIVTTTMPNPPLLTNTIKTAVPGTSISTGTVSGNMIVNTVSGVTPATFQPINKRLVSPVVTGTVSTAGTATTQIVQQRTAGPPSAPTEIVTIATSQGVRAVTPVTGGTVVSTNLASVPSQARAIVTQVTTASTGGVQLAGKTITPAQFQLLRQQTAQVQVPQIQAQTQSPGQLKAVTKISSEHLLKLQKSKVQTGALTGTTAQVQVQPQQAQQLATVTASRAGAVLAGTTMTNLQVARLLQAQGQIQAQPGQTAQVALAKPPVVSAVVSSGGVTTLPVTVAGISVSINQPQKVAGGQTVMAQPLHVQPLLKLKQHHTTQSQQQQKTLQTQATLGQQKPYLSLQITTPQVSSASQQQKVTYTNQPAIKTQFLTTSLSQAQKAAATQQVQAQIQVAKLPQVVQQQATIATLQQVVSASQQVQPQTVTLTQATAAGQQQVQVIPAGSAAAQVVHQKLLQQQVLAAAAAASPQIQAPVGQSPAQASGTPDAQSQQAKLQVRPPTVRIKAPTKPS
ncbi:E1A-binding protein p400-like isoform X2 [Spea bombifrons]|uniref:E1A-binding protein p400-like isoform X2 n=1 Tax=Spea bombifrons TaxID=233779 RepID=UPI00234A08BE|nr:E1A-binding protein p400-like isoform X2 [Spea bombifrons]